MGLRCTMPKCKYVFHGLTGLAELLCLKRHFWRKHKIDLSMDAALKFRVVIEAGEVPVKVDAPART